MSKFALKAEPTFKAKVPFPVHGGVSVDVVLTFRHRTKVALDEFLSTREARSDVASFLDMVIAWELADEFNEANVALLLDNHIGVAVATYRAYVDELLAHRRGN